jgi:hypothetical protein
VTDQVLKLPQAPVILAVLEYGELPELLRVAEAMRSVLAAPSIFFFVKHSYRRLAADTEEVVARGFMWMASDGTLHERPAQAASSLPEAGGQQDIQATTPPVLPSRVNHRTSAGRVLAMAWLPLESGAFLLRSLGETARSTARECANFVRDRKRFRARFQDLDTILARRQPALLIVGQDGPGNDLSLLLIAAGRRSIPRLITPFAMFTIQETAEFATARTDHHVDASAINRVVARMFPHWTLCYKGRRLLRLPGYRALALETTGLIHGLPWTPLSEPSEAITADSKVAADALTKLGVKRDSLHVIGSPVQDRLARNLEHAALLRARICGDRGLDPDKPLILCGWPVNIFSWLSGRAIAYPDYDTLADAWARILAGARDRHQVNILVSIHPKTLQHEYATAERAGLPCARGGVEEMIAACDLFTTLNGSTITSWAIACSKPVLLFDCFQTRYPDFLNVPGCVNVDSEDAFSAELEALCAQPEKRVALARKQRTASADWGTLDGQAGLRLGELVRQLTSQNPHQRKQEH